MTRGQRLALAAQLEAELRQGRRTDHPGLRARIRWLRRGPGSADYRTPRQPGA